MTYSIKNEACSIKAKLSLKVPLQKEKSKLKIDLDKLVNYFFF